MSATVTVDLGKTTCRAAISTPAGTEHRDGPGAPGLAAPGGVDAAFRAISELRVPLADSWIGVGAAGALGSPSARAELADRLQQAGARSVVVTSDVVTAHAGALGGDPGVVLIAGTGAVALAIHPDGRIRRTDGWGPLLGDVGSGGWIGRAGLEAALAATDGRGRASLLPEAAVRTYGVPLDRLPATVTDARECGRFAPAVVEAAGDGDTIAVRILERAAQALADTVVAALPEEADDTPVAVVGGLTNLGEVLLEPLRHNVSRRAAVDWRAPLGDALTGAGLLLDRTDTALEPQVFRIN